VHSFLAQTEYLGEASLGIMLGLVAGVASIPTALLGACLLVAAAGVLVARSRADR
jgi:hypothetical protein